MTAESCWMRVFTEAKRAESTSKQRGACGKALDIVSTGETLASHRIQQSHQGKLLNI